MPNKKSNSKLRSFLLQGTSRSIQTVSNGFLFGFVNELSRFIFGNSKKDTMRKFKTNRDQNSISNQTYYSKIKNSEFFQNFLYGGIVYPCFASLSTKLPFQKITLVKLLYSTLNFLPYYGFNSIWEQESFSGFQRKIKKDFIPLAVINIVLEISSSYLLSNYYKLKSVARNVPTFIRQVSQSASDMQNQQKKVLAFAIVLRYFFTMSFYHERIQIQ